MARGPLYRQSLKRPRGKRRARRFNGRSPRPNRILPKFLTRALRREGGIGNLAIVLQVTAASLVALVLVTVVVAGAAAATTVYSWTQMTSDLPEFEEIEALQFETTKIYDRNDRLLHEVSDPLTGWRTSISYYEITENVERYKDRPGAPEQAWILEAIVAAEDATFWSNPGIDVMAISRSLVTNLTGQPSSGASTITQQLARTMFPESIGQEHSYTRKLREAVMAWHFNQQYEKEEILAMYLNNVYFGNRAYGIDAAAQAYFNEFAWSLSLAEAAMLAGLPQAPSVYDPNENYELAKARQRYVLDRMVALGMISQREAVEAYQEPLSPQRREGRHDLAPHFVNYVRHVIEREYGAEVLFRGGLTVRTTLDYELQLEAERIVREGVADLVSWDVDNGAMIAMLPWSGEILAMVGSADFFNDAIAGQVNVTTRERQPGSSIKPFTYLAALEQGWHPGTVIFDYGKEWETPLADEPVYAPRNATRQFFGALTLREALGNSLNIPAVQALDYVGVEEMIRMSHRLGIRTGLWRGMSHYGLAITLGGGEVSLLEHTNAFATIANNGVYVQHNPFLRILDSEGEVLYELDRENAKSHGDQVVRAEYAYQMTDILTDNDARSMIFGPNSPLVIPELGDRPIAAKTGTTDDSRDGWTMGYTTEVAVGVWVGNTDNSPTRNLDGVAGAAPIWHEFMKLIHTDPEFSMILLGPDGRRISGDFERPPGIVEAEVCQTTGKRPTSGQATVTEVLVDGGSPHLRCDQMNEFDAIDLAAALEDAARNPSMTRRGIEALHEYALAVGVRSQLIREEPDPPPTPVEDDDEDESDDGEEVDAPDGEGSNGDEPAAPDSNDDNGESSGTQSDGSPTTTGDAED